MLEQLIRAIDLGLESFDDTLYNTAKEHEDEAIFLNFKQLEAGLFPDGTSTPLYTQNSIAIKKSRGTLNGDGEHWSIMDSMYWKQKSTMRKTLFGFEIDTESIHKQSIKKYYPADPLNFMGLSQTNEEKFAESISDEFSDKLITIIESGL